MFPSLMFKIFVLPSIFFLQVVVTDSNHHRGHQPRGDVPLSLDSHPGLISRNSFTEASPLPLLPTNEDDALLLPEQFASSPPLDDGGSVGSIIGAESDGCSSTVTQLSNKMRRVKREKGICDAIQGTKKSDPTTPPGQQPRGGQENAGGTTPSSKKSPSPPLARPFRSGGADELCLSFGSYYRVCAPAYRESRTVFITLNLDQCRPFLGLDCNPDETSFCCADIKWNQPSLSSVSLPLFTTAFYTHTGYQCAKTGLAGSGRSSQPPWYWPFRK